LHADILGGNGLVFYQIHNSWHHRYRKAREGRGKSKTGLREQLF